jgi:multimeric flavodoxin WrbA
VDCGLCHESSLREKEVRGDYAVGKKILLLNGSPRANGNTSRLSGAFTKGAERAGHAVHRFNIGEMDIHPCVGCLGGGRDKGSPCTQKDGMEKIYPVFMEAEVLVFASPLYCWSFTAQMKAVIDRFFAVTEAMSGGTDYHTPQKDCLLLIAAEGSDKDNFKPIVDYYRSLLGFLGWTDKGMILAGGVLHSGDIEKTPFLAEAERMGASFD